MAKNKRDSDFRVKVYLQKNVDNLKNEIKSKLNIYICSTYVHMNTFSCLEIPKVFLIAGAHLRVSISSV